MTLNDLQNALMFLNRVCARGDDEEVLVRTVHNISSYVREQKHDGKRQNGDSVLAG
jgi:hypothetical protein